MALRGKGVEDIAKRFQEVLCITKRRPYITCGGRHSTKAPIATPENTARTMVHIEHLQHVLRDCKMTLNHEPGARPDGTPLTEGNTVGNYILSCTVL